MELQEMFDAVVRHLYRQGEQSLDQFGDCVYRAPDGLKCAIGALIKDEEYSEEMEGNLASRKFLNVSTL